MSEIIQVAGKGISVIGNDIDTDRIIPARYMKTITFDDLGKYVFYDERFDENKNKKTHSFNDPKHKDASILIVNKNFGSGSSREHAPQALMHWGIKALIGESFAEIFSGNCQLIGVVCVIASKNNIDSLQSFVEKESDVLININVNQKKVSFGDTSFEIDILESRRKNLLNGTWDMLGLLVDSLDKTKEKTSEIPYLNEFKK